MTKTDNIIEAIPELDLEEITQIRQALDTRVEVLTAEFKNLAAAARGKLARRALTRPSTTQQLHQQTQRNTDNDHNVT